MPNIEGTKQMVSAPGIDDITRDRIRNSVVRVIEVLEEESDALRTGGAIDIDDFSRRKGERLIELNRLFTSSQLTGADLNSLRKPLEELKRKTAENSSLLRAHIYAVEEVAQIIQNAVEKERSDGTYSRAVSQSRLQ